MKNRKKISDKSNDSVNINWLQVLAFGSVNENTNQQVKALNTAVVFEVMP